MGSAGRTMTEPHTPFPQAGGCAFSGQRRQAVTASCQRSFWACGAPKGGQLSPTVGCLGTGVRVRGAEALPPSPSWAPAVWPHRPFPHFLNTRPTDLDVQQALSFQSDSGAGAVRGTHLCRMTASSVKLPYRPFSTRQAAYMALCVHHVTESL